MHKYPGEATVHWKILQKGTSSLQKPPKGQHVGAKKGDHWSEFSSTAVYSAHPVRTLPHGAYLEEPGVRGSESPQEQVQTGSIRCGARVLHTRCVYWGCCVERFSELGGYLLLAPMLLPKSVPDTAEGTWAV